MRMKTFFFPRVELTCASVNNGVCLQIDRRSRICIVEPHMNAHNHRNDDGTDDDSNRNKRRWRRAAARKETEMEPGWQDEMCCFTLIMVLKFQQKAQTGESKTSRPRQRVDSGVLEQPVFFSSFNSHHLAPESKPARRILVCLHQSWQQEATISGGWGSGGKILSVGGRREQRRDGWGENGGMIDACQSNFTVFSFRTLWGARMNRKYVCVCK